MSDTLPPDLRAAAALGGEMGRRLLSFPWEEHPLGAPAGWSASMRTTVATALASRFPTVLWLGERLHLVYNDGYIPMLGEKHPAALGRAGAEVWWDIWDVIDPMLASVMKSGVATWSDDLMLMMDHAGRREERYFTFTYSPIIGEDGRCEGVFCVVNETTERVLGERRLQALNALAAALIDAQSADHALTAAIEVCAAHDADLPFAAVYLAEGPLPAARLHRATPGAADLLPPSLPALLDGSGTGTGSGTRTGSGAGAGSGGFQIARGLRSRIPGLAARFGERCPEQALVIGVGEIADGPPAAALVLGLNCCRPLDEQYRGFCRLVADQVSAALASARAYEDERRRAESLAALDRAKTAFLTNVSHEFRTPLTLMLGPLDDLIAAAADGDSTAERLKMIRRNGRRLLRLVNALLDFSRIEAGQTAPQLAAADAGALTAGIASSFADVCGLAGIELILDCRPAPAQLDPAMWETIALNLISNAFKYTFSGSITVRAGPGPDGGVEFVVADTGVGIPPDHLPHLFERFYRTSGTPGRSAEGSGIGLALVKSLVEMHGGVIEVDSALGTGTAVTVRLPQPATPAGDQPAAPAGDQPAAPAAVAAALGNAYVDEALQWLGTGDPAGTPDGYPYGSPDRSLVLVADDNADMRRHLAEVLRGRWNVIVAGDGRQALDLARRYHPDLLVTDVMMPVMDGFDLVSAIRADPELAPLPVIMLSARAGSEAAGEGLAAGADNYLVKPFNSADLVNSVAARLEAAGRDRSRAPGDQLTARRALALAEREHQIAIALQERLLDLGTGSPAAVASALYQPAGQTMRVGGDWYTVTPIDEHRVGVSAGDVVGHGLPAAAVMSQLRSALGAAALAAAGPAAVLDVLDRYAGNLREATFATVAYAIVDAAAGTVDYICAGHPYPLIVAADGTVRYLLEGRRTPLATRSSAAAPSAARTSIAPGSLLLLYTDGLVERRGESLDAGFARLAEAAAECAMMPAADACARLLSRMQGDDGYEDDVAMVAVRPVGTAPTSHVDALHASFAEVAAARSRLRAWLRGLPLSPAQAHRILLSVGEAVSNAIEHGSELDPDRTVGIEAFAEPHRITVTVTDSGHWAEDSTAASRSANRGRGLKLIQGLSDDVRTIRAPLGTRVTMSYRLRPPPPDTEEAAAP